MTDRRFTVRKSPGGWWDVIDKKQIGEARVCLCYSTEFSTDEGPEANAREAAKILNEAEGEAP